MTEPAREDHGVSRRTLLLGALPALASGPAPDWRKTLSDRAAGLGLLQSYEVIPGSSVPFDRTQAGCAYVYDNAVAGLALLAAGDRPAAERIGAALAAAQAHDRFWHDGRLRNAYRPGRVSNGLYPLSGWWDAGQGKWVEDAYQAGTATGVVAWAMLLWIGLGGAFTAPAQRAADWVEHTVRGPRGFYGGFLGFEPSPQRLTWVSTEHNVDLAAAFTALGRAEAAAHAGSFVAEMWLPAERRFATGLRPDGSLNDHSAVDANLWPLLGAGAQPAWRPAFDWVLARHGLPAGAPQDQVSGVDFNTDRDGIWLEGTAITAVTAHSLGATEQAARLMRTLRAQTSASGLIYASTTPTLTTGLSTGLDTHAPDFLYFRRPHLAPTAWALLAGLGANPFPKAG